MTLKGANTLRRAQGISHISPPLLNAVGVAVVRIFRPQGCPKTAQPSAPEFDAFSAMRQIQHPECPCLETHAHISTYSATKY